MGRTVSEWCGKTDDTPVPDRVRLRVADKAGWNCALCTRNLISKPWICDHKIAIINGGENRERNLQAICVGCDKTVKTPADVAEKSAVYESRLRHAGLKKAKQPFRGWRKFNGDIVRART